MFWQFTPRGRVSGIPTFVDVIVLQKQLLDFKHVIEARK